MTLEAAPLFEEIAGGPPGGSALWVKTSDDVRIRVGCWRPEGTARGTVLMFPGRTEYIEKYGPTAGEFARRGFATLVVDWRGQGLADRLLPDHRVGHVETFSDYQKDIAGVLRAARHLDLPRPWHLLAHSMGGGIGLRAVMEGLPVQSCAFTGPMWGIYMPPVLRPLGWGLALAAPKIGLGHRLPPSSNFENYVLVNPFEGNLLTRDAGVYDWMRDQIETHPELSIGGPSLNWLREALCETRHLAERASPDLPCLCFVGTDEKIVDVASIRARMNIWPRGVLEIVPDAEHEVLMEVQSTRDFTFDRLEAHFTGSREATETATGA